MVFSSRIMCLILSFPFSYPLCHHYVFTSISNPYHICFASPSNFYSLLYLSVLHSHSILSSKWQQRERKLKTNQVQKLTQEHSVRTKIHDFHTPVFHPGNLSNTRSCFHTINKYDSMLRLESRTALRRNWNFPSPSISSFTMPSNLRQSSKRLNV